MIFFTSDQHFGHENILRNLGSGRPFNSLNHMHSCIRANWFSSVSAEDTVYVLGDAAMGLFEETVQLFSDLPGSKFFVPGNHDRIGRTQSKARNERFRPLYEAAGFEVLEDVSWLNVDTSYGVQRVVLSHYPYAESSHSDGSEVVRDKFRKFRPVDEGFPLIHGHTHSRDRLNPEQPLQFHVGVDANSFAPVPLTEVQLWLESLRSDGVI